MNRKKFNLPEDTPQNANEPLEHFKHMPVHIFHSFEEQAEWELNEMAKLSSIEILQKLRMFINIAYGMHGYDPDKLPLKHTVKIINQS